MLFLPILDVSRCDERAMSILFAIAEASDVNHTSLPRELPGRNLFHEHLSGRMSVRQPGRRRRDRMWRSVQLRAGVSVNRDDLRVIGAVFSDTEVRVELEKRPLIARPGGRSFVATGSDKSEIERALSPGAETAIDKAAMKREAVKGFLCRIILYLGVERGKHSW